MNKVLPSPKHGPIKTCPTQVVVNVSSGLCCWLLGTGRWTSPNDIMALVSAFTRSVPWNRHAVFPFLRNPTITHCFLFRWGEVAILQLLHMAPPGLVIYPGTVKNWMHLLNACHTPILLQTHIFWSLTKNLRCSCWPPVETYGLIKSSLVLIFWPRRSCAGLRSVVACGTDWYVGTY